MKKLLAVVIFSLLLGNIFAQVKLPQLVRDSMVLQRDAPIRVWGWAAASEKVTLKFNNKVYKATAGRDGQWQVRLLPMKAGGPYTMQIDASNHLTLKDILLGDVWICSGQSNMVHQMILHRERYEQDIASANYPAIRHFWIPTMTDLQGPHNDLPTGYWKAANPQDVLQFSAVAYFFARRLYDQYKVPIGLINASVGGTPIQAWTSEEGLKAFPPITATVAQNKDTAYTNGLLRASAAYNASQPKQMDKGLTGPLPWYDVNYQPAGWRSINVPGYWEDQGVKELDGVVWYRKEVDVPAAIANSTAKIALGRIIDADVLYVNGRQAGNTTYQYPQRRYTIPAGLLHAGKNLLVVRVTNNAGKGGFVPDKPYYLCAGKDTIDLKGTWQYRVGNVFIPQRNTPPGFSAQNSPTALYNAMLAPVTPYTIKGFLWYQGEANTGNAGEYAALMSALIGDWRNKWGQGNLPFLYAQLPNFMDAQYLPAESQWAATREAQLKALSVPNTGMAVTIDLGEWNDIHPDNKKDVGERLSLLAEKLAYGDQQVVASGPLYDTAVADGSRIIVSFRYTGSGLITKDGEAPGEFAIAGADKKFVWAQAKIEGNKVIVWNDAIARPLYVRYAWADNPVNPNLYNKEGLPASPFRAEVLSPGTAAAPGTDKGLKDYYAAYFPVGVAVSPRTLQSAEGSLVLQQFNSLTPENAMKMGNIHPREHEYFWRDADSIVAFAQRNHLRMRGHTLCWHNQTPAWLFKDSSGNTVSKEVLLQRLKDHITTVVSRYKGKIYAWDVVNEAISDKPDEYLRPSKWLEIIGEDYIAKAFQWAHEADPNTLLFYNDYNEISAVKRAKICRLVKSLQQQGVPIHAVGLQGHWAVNEPSYEQLDSTLQQFSQLGLKLQITELDISVYPKEHNARERRPEDAQNSFTPEREQQQMEKYKMVFQLFRKYQPFITGVTFWNLSERYSWLDNFPVRGRKDYPLLFDQNLLPKKAYWEVVKF